MFTDEEIKTQPVQDYLLWKLRQEEAKNKLAEIQSKQMQAQAEMKIEDFKKQR